MNEFKIFLVYLSMSLFLVCSCPSMDQMGNDDCPSSSKWR